MTDYFYSLSKQYSFDYCKRKYYYDYIIDSEYEYNKEIKKIFLLKNLKNRFIIKTEILKKTVSEFFNNKIYGFEYSINEYIKNTIKQISDFIFNNKTCYENYYGLLDTIDWSVYFTEIEFILKSFFQSNITNHILSFDTDTWILPLLENKLFFNYSDIKFSGVPDFLILTPEKLYYFIWKFNNKKFNTNDNIKLILGLLYCETEYMFIRKKITPVIYNFVTKQKITEFPENSEINSNIEKLKQKALNLELVSSNNIQDFNKISDKNKCKFCKYKNVCQKKIKNQ